MNQNLAYALTKFDSIPDSKPTNRYEPVICPHCGHGDRGADGYIGVTKCFSCGLLYFIKRDDYYADGSKIPKELPF